MNAIPQRTTGRTGENTPKAKNSKQATSNRFGVLNAFVDCSMGGLSKAEIATWLCLYRDTKNGIAQTSQADIARRAGVSLRAVKYAISKLLKVGLIVRVYKGGLNSGPSRYRVEPLVKLIAPAQGQKPVRRW